MNGKKISTDYLELKRKLSDDDNVIIQSPTIRNNKYFLRNHISEKDKLIIAFDKGFRRIALMMDPISKKLPLSNPSKTRNAIERSIQKYKNIDKINVTRNSSIIFWSTDLECLKEIISLNYFMDIPVKVKVIESMITNKYLIRDISPEISLEDIGEELSEQEITWLSICRFTRIVESVKSPTKSVLITEIEFSQSSEIRLWYQIFRTYKFIERPRICGKCQYFGHIAINCKNSEHCSSCSESHASHSCSNPILKCIRCKGNHSALDKDCETYIMEEKILNYKNERKISYVEARNECVKNKKTYAKVVANESEKSETTIELFKSINNMSTQINMLTSIVQKQSELLGMMMATINMQKNLKLTVDDSIEIENFQTENLYDDVEDRAKEMELLKDSVTLTMDLKSTETSEFYNFKKDISDIPLPRTNSGREKISFKLHKDEDKQKKKLKKKNNFYED